MSIAKRIDDCIGQANAIYVGEFVYKNLKEQSLLDEMNNLNEKYFEIMKGQRNG